MTCKNDTPSLDTQLFLENIVQNEQIVNILQADDQLSETDRMHWVALISVEGVGLQTLFFIHNYLKKNRISWHDFWVKNGRVSQKKPIFEKIESSIKKFKKEYTISSYWQLLLSKGISVVTVLDPHYPLLLKQISDPPALLFVKGEPDLLNGLSIAVIGTRRMTPYGRMVTQKIVGELVANEVLIISGFMYGVDVMAQRTAIQKDGCTVGVLGYGFDHIFPRHQEELYQQMLQTKKAVFISEYAPFTSPTKGTFPRRNRIIAGLSLGVVVTEAGSKSGTQITVGYALDYGRDVFAVSGPVTSIYHEGTKQMINQGAVLVGSGGEVISNLSAKNWEMSCLSKKAPQVDACINNALKLDSLDQAIVGALQIMPLTIGGLSKQLQLDSAVLMQRLAKLELNALVNCHGSYWQSCR